MLLRKRERKRKRKRKKKKKERAESVLAQVGENTEGRRKEG